jgi:hypothetical protein
LFFQFKQPGVNRKLLAYYVNEDGRAVAEAYDYVTREMTQPPDDHEMEATLGAHASYASTYSLGINSLLEQCRGPAIRAADLTTIDAAGFWNLATEAKRTLRANLPGKFREDRARFFESMLEKNLVIPTVKTIPVIDGDLSDEVWGSAVELKGFTERGTYRTSRHGTTGRVMRVGDALVFGIECRQVGPIVVGTKKEIMSGGRLWKESSVEFHFGVPAAKSGEAATMAQYIVNANGAFQGFRVARDNREGCLVEVRKDDGKGVYTIEAAFPLKAPGYDFTPSRVLLLNLMRDVFTSVPATQAEDAIITWYPTPYTCYKDDSLGLVYTAP